MQHQVHSGRDSPPAEVYADDPGLDCPDRIPLSSSQDIVPQKHEAAYNRRKQSFQLQRKLKELITQAQFYEQSIS